VVRIVRKRCAQDNDVLETAYPTMGQGRALIAYFWSVKSGLAKFKYEGGGQPTSVRSEMQLKYLPLASTTSSDGPRHKRGQEVRSGE
jgi:hypothetical protein